MSRMRFGAFIPPHHPPTHYNPTYALQRDVEIVQLLDSIGPQPTTASQVAAGR
ncbi:MAG: hypothetical protein IPM80_10160 [Proteobacteria bacterium]|nr:hypothetical protein [Pseudomonadota bacterium]